MAVAQILTPLRWLHTLSLCCPVKHALMKRRTRRRRKRGSAGCEVRGPCGWCTNCQRPQRKRRRKRNLHHGDKQIYSPQGVVSMTVWFCIRAQRTGRRRERERGRRREDRAGNVNQVKLGKKESKSGISNTGRLTKRNKQFSSKHTSTRPFIHQQNTKEEAGCRHRPAGGCWT